MKLSLIIAVFLSSGAFATDIGSPVDADKSGVLKVRSIKEKPQGPSEFVKETKARMLARRQQQDRQIVLDEQSFRQAKKTELDAQRAELDAQRVFEKVTLDTKVPQESEHKQQNSTIKIDVDCEATNQLLTDWDTLLAKNTNPQQISKKRNEAYKRGLLIEGSRSSGRDAIIKFNGMQKKLEQEIILKRGEIQQRVIDLGC